MAFEDSLTPWEEVTERNARLAARAALEGAKDVDSSIASGLEAGKGEIAAAAATAVAGVPDALKKKKSEIKKTAAEIAHDIAAAISGERETIDSLVEQLNERHGKPTISLTTEVNNLLSTLFSPSLAKDLKSPDELTRAIARELKESIEQRLKEINLRPGIVSDKTKKLIEDATKDTNPVVKDLGTDVADIYVDSLVLGLRSPANKKAVLDAFRALLPSLPAVVGAGVKSALTINPSTGFTVPVLDRGMPRVPFDGMPAILHRDEAVLTDEQAAAWRSGDGRTQNIYIDTVELADAHDEQSVIESLRFMALAG